MKGSTYNAIKLFVQIFLSLVLTTACLYIILMNNYSTDSSKWAYGMLGLVIGYWLK